MALHKGWLAKYTPKTLKRRVASLPLSIAELEKKRADAALRKRKSREAMREDFRDRMRRESAACADLLWLRRFIVETDDRPGCWIWKGPWERSFEKAKPLVRRYEYGKMFADRAMWAALERPGLIKRSYLATKCGHDDCISPDHLYVTNTTLERARKNVSRETVATEQVA